MSKGFQKAAEVNRKRIVELFQQGKSPSEIMELVGCSLSHIQHIVTEYGLAEGRLNTKRICQVVSHLLYTLESYSEISRKLGIAPGIVSKIGRQAKEAGILFPPRQVGRPKIKD